VLIRRDAHPSKQVERGVELQPEIGQRLPNKGDVLAAATAIVELAEPAFDPGFRVRRQDIAEIDQRICRQILCFRSDGYGNEKDRGNRGRCTYEHSAHASGMSQSGFPSAVLRATVAPRQFLTVLTALLFALAALSASAAAIHRIIQKGRTFSVPEIAIAQGDIVQFTNDDEFLHQIYVDFRG